MKFKMVDEEIKQDTGPCSSYVLRNKESVQCGEPGERKYDNTLDAGIHCDDCWSEMINQCRRRSW